MIPIGYSGLPIRQVAYFVQDVRAAAAAHAAAFGSGPYFVADNIPLRRCLHRGVEAHLDHSSAYGQWGELMIEFVQQNNPGPSAFRDMFSEGREGFHHVAIIVDDLDAARARMEAAGFPTALEAEMHDGFRFLMMDAVERHGHMIELYAGVPTLTGFYDFVKKAAAGWDGSNPVRTISLG
ncbi:VOC family protein [Sphingobium phenoxybenzoativorans]|uniref:VOC family protein n=1 Tax=Sphingobium phenoxybenzoativorans TaxID=1592790 RepID=A0A975K417_9SPHN|nr:VOC family protein [Sphingobium phenoxybenzoativorans]QUT04142.1 VOC family protein [Sphingobium phenoxybenzoativorans]